MGRTVAVQWAKTRKEVLIRDDWKCQKCGLDLKKMRSEIHHINAFCVSLLDKNGKEKLENLMAFCQYCHPAEHREDFWKWLKSDCIPFRDLVEEAKEMWCKRKNKIYKKMSDMEFKIFIEKMNRMRE